MMPQHVTSGLPIARGSPTPAIRSGIPVTLSLLFMEVARNVGLPMKVR
jgi:hypothetical protein